MGKTQDAIDKRQKARVAELAKAAKAAKPKAAPKPKSDTTSG